MAVDRGQAGRASARPANGHDGGTGLRARRAPVRPPRSFGSRRATSAFAPLAEARAAVVPPGTTYHRGRSFLVLRYGGLASGLASFGGCPAAARRLPSPHGAGISFRRRTAPEAQPSVLLALQARRKGEGHFAPPLCTPYPAREAASLRAALAIAGVAGRQRGRVCAPLGTPRSARRSHAADAAPISAPVLQPQTRTAGPDRWPAVVTVRGHRLRSLYRRTHSTLRSLCWKYRLGPGGGAPQTFTRTVPIISTRIVHEERLSAAWEREARHGISSVARWAPVAVNRAAPGPPLRCGPIG